MDGLAHVANQLAQIDMVGGVARVDPRQVAEFERLMQNPQAGQPAVDVYTTKIESPTDTVVAALLRTGNQISDTYARQWEKASNGLTGVDRTDMVAMSEHLLDAQRGLAAASFQVQFVSSLVETANKGISALFHMQG